jgi:DNA-binding response OmpR family regulator
MANVTCRNQPHASSRQAARRCRGRQVSSYRVLVLDDSALNLDILRVVLAVEGFEVLVARDVDEARRLAEETYPDIGLLDVRVPGAFELVDHLKDHGRPRPALLVGLLAYDSIQQAEALLDAGFDDCLPKPINTRDLPRFLRDHLARRDPVA